LSGGEKSRLILAKLLIYPPNFMLLDEPTTHLDMDGVKALTNAFKVYEGTLCFISHDLYFIKEIADHIVDVSDGQIKIYPGGLEYYLEKTGRKGVIGSEKVQQAAVIQEAEPRKAEQKKKLKKQKQKDNPALEELNSKHKTALKRISQIKNEIKRLQEEQKELETESYVKARKLSQSYENRDAGIIKEYGQRLKLIQKRQREIERTIKGLKEERNKISK